jgi:hypothetical protein
MEIRGWEGCLRVEKQWDKDKVTAKGRNKGQPLQLEPWVHMRDNTVGRWLGPGDGVGITDLGVQILGRWGPMYT